jgi:uncharacterized LabA/DUF88 family protein
MISDDLRRQADHFIDLASLRSEIGRSAAEREARLARRAELDAEADQDEEG